MRICGAKTKSGRPCLGKAMRNGRCRLHGGATPRGPDSPHFKHGRYAYAFKGELLERFKRAAIDNRPLDLLPELAVQRALFETYIGRFEPGIALSGDDIHNMMAYADSIGRMAERITKARNDTALTIAEITFLRAGIADLLNEFIPDNDQRQAFIARLSEYIPARLGATSDAG